MPFLALLRSETKPRMIVCIIKAGSLTAIDEASTLPDSAASITAVSTTSSGETDIPLVSSTIPQITPNPSAYLSLDPSTVTALPYPTASAYLPLDSTTSTTIPSAYLPLDSTTEAANPSTYLPLDSTTGAANPSTYLPLDPSTTAWYVRVTIHAEGHD